jgi:hypothetical protein
VNNAPISQGIASSGGMLPFLLILLLGGPAATWAWVGSNSLAALVSILICYVTATFVLDKRSGHRWLHALAFIYFFLRSVAHIWIAFDWWFHIQHLPYWLSSLSNCAEIIFGMYFYVTRRDLSVTYKRSERARQVNVQRLENISQAATDLGLIASTQLATARQLQEGIHNVGRDT